MLNRRDVIVGSAATAMLAAAHAKAATMETYYFMVFLNPAGTEDDFNHFYDTRHVFDVTAVPGFVNGQRFVRNETQMYPNVEPKLAKYLALYTIRTDNLDAVTADVSNRIKTGITKIPKPSPFEAGTGQSYYYRFNASEMKRTLPVPADFAGKKLVNYDHIVFMDPLEGKQKEWEEWYDHTHAPEMLTGAGVMTAQRTTVVVRPGKASPAPTQDMVLFRVQMPEGMPASAAAPKSASGGDSGPQDFKTTRGYTYRQIGPLVTHEEAVAKKATFTD
jgi:hypothetical protein